MPHETTAIVRVKAAAHRARFGVPLKHPDIVRHKQWGCTWAWTRYQETRDGIAQTDFIEITWKLAPDPTVPKEAW